MQVHIQRKLVIAMTTVLAAGCSSESEKTSGAESAIGANAPAATAGGADPMLQCSLVYRSYGDGENYDARGPTAGARLSELVGHAAHVGDGNYDLAFVISNQPMTTPFILQILREGGGPYGAPAIAELQAQAPTVGGAPFVLAAEIQPLLLRGDDGVAHYFTVAKVTCTMQ